MNTIVTTAIEGEYDSYIDNFPSRLISGSLNYVSKDYRNDLINNFNTLTGEL